MKTYNFVITIGPTLFRVDIDAKTEEEAISIIRKEYSSKDGFNYILG